MFGLGRKSRVPYTAVEAITVPPEKEAEFVALRACGSPVDARRIGKDGRTRLIEPRDRGRAAVGNVERLSADFAPFGAMHGASGADRRSIEQALPQDSGEIR